MYNKVVNERINEVTNLNMGRKLNSIQDEIFNLEISKEANQVTNEPEAVKEAKVEEKKPSNIFEATKIRQQDQEQKEINKAKLNPSFKAFIPARKVLDERKSVTIYIKRKTIEKLKKTAKNKGYSLGEIIEFLVDGIQE